MQNITSQTQKQKARTRLMENIFRILIWFCSISHFQHDHTLPLPIVYQQGEILSHAQTHRVNPNLIPSRPQLWHSLNLSKLRPIQHN